VIRCAETAAPEPLAGTAPIARWWWLIEVPGSWGRQAVKDCRIPAVRSLVSDDLRRVILVRRPGRHPAADDMPLRVWIAGSLPGDPEPRAAIADDPEEILGWPVEGPSGAMPDPDSPRLAVCTNSSRDLCCGLDGRALVSALDDHRVWECSHLGGHRFAPTALLVGTGLVYGRLTADVARALLAGDPGAVPWLRGRSSLPPAAQAAEAHLLALGDTPDPARVDVVDVDPDTAVVSFGPEIQVRMARISGAPRPASCGADPEPWAAWQPVA
jgi:hypothetical protein